MNAISKSSTVQCRANSQFRFGVFCANPTHILRSLSNTEVVHSPILWLTLPPIQSSPKDAFSKYLDTTRFNANQIRFIEMIINHLTQKGTMDAGMLYEQPFTNLHYTGVEGVFKGEDAVVGEILGVIRSINANAEGGSVA